MSLCVSRISIKGASVNGSLSDAEVCAAVLWRTLNLCPATANDMHRAENTPTSLTLDFKRNFGKSNTISIIGSLTSNFPALTQSLQKLSITHSDYDENTDLGAFAALATHLQELTFWWCGLTSLRGLEGRCEYLRKVDILGHRQLSSLSGLEHHMRLEEVCVAGTGISSVEPLLTCPALTKVVLNNCQLLKSLSGLENHPRLKEVSATRTSITSVRELLSCPGLETVELLRCEKLASLSGLEHHLLLEVVDASGTAVTSLEPLLSCPNLKTVDLSDCRPCVLSSTSMFPASVRVVQ